MRNGVDREVFVKEYKILDRQAEYILEVLYKIVTIVNILYS
jgi:hypothetical protein